MNKYPTPDASMPPLVSEGPRRKMVITIEVSAGFEKRLDNQWEVEREIESDRWSWSWADELTDLNHYRKAIQKALIALNLFEPVRRQIISSSKSGTAFDEALEAINELGIKP